MDNVTHLLSRIEDGDPHAAADLLPVVYNELRRLASSRMRDEKSPTLQPTALVHEAFLRLVDQSDADQWQNKAHFFSAASEAMRRILVERARARATQKRGGGVPRVPLAENLVAREEKSEQILAISEALDALGKHDPIAADLVKLRFFGGLGHQDAASALRMTRGEADRRWRLARAWLFKTLNRE